MFRIDDATAATTLPVPETAGTPGFFTEGNAAAGTPATNVRASFLNMMQEELMSVLTAAGLTPSKATYNQLLTALRSAGVFQTPQQFDNSTKPATTAFVQSMLGNLRPQVIPVTGSVSLTAAQGGSIIDISAPAGGTVTLPAHQSGLTFYLNNYGTAGVTISASSGGFNPMSGASNPSSFVLQANTSVQVASDGTNWVVFGGTGASSLSQNGYEKTLNGRIMQWVFSPSTAVPANTQTTVSATLPIAFPRGNLFTIPVIYATYGTNVGVTCSINSGGLTSVSAVVNSTGSQNVVIAFLCIGY